MIFAALVKVRSLYNSKKKTIFQLDMKLYQESLSFFSQSCLLLIKNLNLNIEIDDHEPHDEKFVNDVNQIFKVPIFVDNELVLTEPRAIMTFLIDLLQPECPLYPKDLKRRALIDQRLFYDASVVVPALMNVLRKVIIVKRKEISQKTKDAFLAVVRVLEGLLANNDYFSGNEFTIADISILPSVAVAHKLGLNWTQFPHLYEWFTRMQNVAGFNTIEDCASFISKSVEKITGKCVL